MEAIYEYIYLQFIHFCYSDENEMNFHKCKKNLPCVKSELANN
jgi:hypothetical protein